MSLPTPFQGLARFAKTYELHCALDEMVKAYGQACRAAALEEAALFISGGSFLHDQSPVKMWANQLVPKIRSLK